MYDLTIIGAGPGGYAAAMRAAETGAKICVVERDLVGGVCLNRGCIPTKAIIQSLQILRGIEKAGEFGIDVSGYNVDIKKILKRKDDIVSRLRQGVEKALKSKGVEVVKASASFKDKDTIDVDGKTIDSKYIIIATGSVPVEADPLMPDHKEVLSSDDILNLDTVPTSIAIIGSGAIGCEFASIYNRLGAKVTMIEVCRQILPSEDNETARRLESFLKEAGVEIIKGAKVSYIKRAKGTRIGLDKDKEIEAKKVLLCIGRKPNISGLNLDAAGIKYNVGIEVDSTLKTSAANIYAIGDVTGRHYLAHVASYEGIVAADNIFGIKRIADYAAVPNCTYTDPELASVGITEEAVKESGIDFFVTKIPFAAVSRAHILGRAEGMIKLIGEEKTDKILGVHIIGHQASELISVFATAIRHGIKAKGLADVIYAHPTISEAVSELANRIR